MSRWQLRAVSLYSHDSRRRDLFFDLNSVNIVTVPSGSGKSAICEVIDYCLGSGECHIPGVVRDASSWVSVLLATSTTQVFLARRVPPPNQLSSEETFVAIGGRLELPPSAADLAGNTNVSTMLRKLEQLFGIGDAVTEVFDAPRQPHRVTARNITPFLLQDDDVIINKTVLLRGAQDERRFSIIDTFPYFLGVVDEGSIARAQELRRVRAQAAAEERRLESLDRERDTRVVETKAIAAEAQQVGLLTVPINDSSTEVLHSALVKASQYVPSLGAETEGDRLTELSSTDKRLRRQRVLLMTELDEVRDAFYEASEFVTTTEGQQRRLQVVDLFDTNNEANQFCPVCSNRIIEQTETLQSVRTAFQELQNQLRSAERERPQIDAYIRSLQERIEGLSQQLSVVGAQLDAVRRESESVQQQLDLAQRRMRVAGRVSYFLESQRASQGPEVTSRLPALQRRISELRQELDSVNKLERLQDAQQQVALAANDILDDLPFAALYPQRAVYLNTRDLSTGILTEQRRIPMRDIGSDENYLSLHVAIALGLHRYFKIHLRPIPGFIVFDQLSRPFYPPDQMPGVITTRSDAERGDLKKYFDVLFKEVAAQGDLQIIVLEHAYFADDPRFVKAVGERSLEPHKLVPADWPIRA